MMNNEGGATDQQADSQPRYPIGVVAQRTGLSTHVLRAWERRYGLVDPGRDENGVRLYSNADIVRLRLLKRVTEGGHPIGRVAALDTRGLLALAREADRAADLAGAARVPEAADRFVAACLEAVEAMDGVRIHGVLMKAVVGLGLMEFVEGVVSPLLRRTGELWAGGELCPAHEHLLSVRVHRVLDWLLETLPNAPGAPLLLATTPAGQRHELGAMLAGVVAADVGWRAVYFGPDLPAGDIARAAATTGADAVALSLVHRDDPESAREELRELRARLPGRVHLFVGGPAAAQHRDHLRAEGIGCLPDLASLRAALRATGLLPEG